MHTDQEIAQGTDILEASKETQKLLKTTSKLHFVKKSVFSSNCDPNIFRLVVLSLVAGSSIITSFTLSSKIIISVVERVFISAQLQNGRFSWRCRAGTRLVYIRATPHHTSLIPSRWTQLQQDVQPFVGTNIVLCNNLYKPR